MRPKDLMGRRDFLKATFYTGTIAALSGMGLQKVLAATDGTINFADIGVGDPGGDWSKFTAQTGWKVNLVAIGNAPSTILNVLIAGGGMQTYDVINIVGGMQKPLVDNDLILEIDTNRIPNWKKNTYIQQHIAPGSPGFNFIGYQKKIYGVPTVLQGDSFAYLEDVTGPLNSYGALFDPKWKGYVALEDNYTTAGQKTALYLKANKLAEINDPADMSPGEIKTVIDFLIEKKKEGQFRVIWTGFEQAVNLLVSREVYVMDCWEPMVFVAKNKGARAVYADPREGYLLWAMAAYLVNNPKRPAERTQVAYDLMNFILGPWYGAKITSMRGYMTNPQAPVYAAAHPAEFSAAESQNISDISSGVKRKFDQGGTWQNRWPKHVEVYESEWARFKAARSG